MSDENNEEKKSRFDYKSIVYLFYKFDKNQITKEEALLILKNKYGYSLISATELLKNNKSRELLQPFFDQNFGLK